jgi:protein-tyrosine phosphatase
MKQVETGRTLLYHFSTGKDRAGFATFLLLSALDVAPDAFLANQLESIHWNRRLVQGLRHGQRIESFDSSRERARLKPHRARTVSHPEAVPHVRLTAIDAPA